ncbi:MAG: sigma-E factor negative regulatory protein [Gammaproteobacteria bacterium]|jgi:negative regulator of sigma E activity
MSEEAKEQISALMDGEVSADRRLRIVDKLLCEPQLVKAWERYNLISDVLRNNVRETALGPPLLAQRNIVQGAQDKEPVDASSKARQFEGLSFSYVAKQVAEVIRQEPLPFRRQRPIAIRPALGLALAASIAIVAVLGVQRVAQHSSQSDAEPALQATAPAQNRLVTAASTDDDHERAAKARLASYLVNYSEYLDNGMRGLLPYARIVSRHDANNP